MLLVTGFLGAGKTTLIRGLLAEFGQAGISADVIINDVTDPTLDAATFAADAAASVVPLAASCACCESADQLLEHSLTASHSDSDLLIVELNGTADPLAVLETFTLQNVQDQFSPWLQVCVVDARHWGDRGALTPLEHRQLEGAGAYRITHTDEVSADRPEALQAAIQASFPASQRVSPEQLQGLLLATLGRSTAAPQSTADTESLARSVPASGLHVHDAIHQLSHQVKGVQVPLPPRVRRAAIEQLLAALPERVLRAKALVKLMDQPGSRWLFEKSGHQVIPEPIPVPSGARLSASLLCIGVDLDPDQLKDLVAGQFGSSATTLV